MHTGTHATHAPIESLIWYVSNNLIHLLKKNHLRCDTSNRQHYIYGRLNKGETYEKDHFAHRTYYVADGLR